MFDFSICDKRSPPPPAPPEEKPIEMIIIVMVTSGFVVNRVVKRGNYFRFDDVFELICIFSGPFA